MSSSAKSRALPPLKPLGSLPTQHVNTKAAPTEEEERALALLWLSCNSPGDEMMPHDASSDVSSDVVFLLAPPWWAAKAAEQLLPEPGARSLGGASTNGVFLGGWAQVHLRLETFPILVSVWSAAGSKGCDDLPTGGSSSMIPRNM